MNYLASFQLNPLEYPLNSYIRDAFYSAIRFYPDLFIKLSEDIDKGLKKDINSKEYEYAKSALDTLTQMYDSYIPSAILKLNTPTQITFTQLIELSKQIASAPHCGPKNR
ncbi:MAG: hypothetical protein A3F11_02220 [Gammaproteobacteria bacterium RIFCSPHIGHO2_12_FULL_37_14]|nr:MAG: hypothetical protein A3F11_02220 [Gammaproteobacteria bacterium RIFCSPHIGHO2_12_FULL_37_14]